MNITRNTKILSFFLSLLMVLSIFSCLALPSMADEEGEQVENTEEPAVTDPATDPDADPDATPDTETDTEEDGEGTTEDGTEGEEPVVEYLTVEEALNTYLTTEYATREEKLATMQLRLTKGDIELYCDSKTGEIAVKNTKSGQILMTNPYDVATATTDTVKADLLSQINISFNDLTNMGTPRTMNSFTDAAQRGQIKVQNIKNGLRLEYTLGKDASKKLMPLWIEASRMETMILPKIAEVGDDFLYRNFCGWYTRIAITEETLQAQIAQYKEAYPIVTQTYAKAGYTPTVTETSVLQADGSTKTFKYTGGDQTVAIYVLASTAIASERESNVIEGHIKAYCPDYSYAEQEFDINLTGYVGEDGAVAIFKMALEYYLTDNGFEVRLPSNGIRFDEESYQLTNLTILKYLGASSNDFTGYTFIPDGSGTIIRNEDIVASGAGYDIGGPIYGPDYSYHDVTARSYNGKGEIMRLPIYGTIENTVYYNYDKDPVGWHYIYSTDELGNYILDSRGYKIPLYELYDGEPVTGFLDEELGQYVYYYTDTLIEQEVTDDPADGTDTPADGTDTPADGTDTPADGTDTPADGTDTPADGTDAPAEGTDTPTTAADAEAGDDTATGTDGETEGEGEGETTEPEVTLVPGPDSVICEDVIEERGAGGAVTLYKKGEDGKKIRQIEYEYESYTVPQGFLAVIDSGESITNLTSHHGGNITHKYNTVYPTFFPLSTDTYNLAESISVGTDAEWAVTSERKYTGSFKINYILVSDYEGSKYEGTYEGMAKAYQDYLIENQGLAKISETAADIPLYIESFGMLETQGTFLTIPVWVDTPLTTTEDVQSMYGKLAEAGITNVNFRLKGFTEGGMDYQLAPTKVKFENVVGGKEGYEALVDDAQAKGYGVFPEFDFAYTSGSAWFDGFDQSNWTVRTIDDRAARKREYDAIYQSFQYVFSIAISPWAYDQMLDKFVDQMSDYKIDGLSFSTLGSDLNSDFDEDDPYNREDNKNFTVDLLKQLNEKYDNIMVDGGNAYAYGYVDHILNLPLDGSRYLRASQSVPFIGMVLHSYVNYAGTPTNMEGDIEYEILKIIENGASPYFILSAQNTNELKDWVNVAQYYSVNFDIWFEDLVEIYTAINGALKDVQTSSIVSHEFIDGERKLSEEEDALVKAEEEEARAAYTEQYNVDLLAAVREAIGIGEVVVPEDYVLVEEDGTVNVPEDFDMETFTADYLTFEESFNPSVDVVIDNSTIVYETFENGISFVLNYNNFDVTVEMNGEDVLVSALGFVKFDANGNALPNA